MVIYVTAIENLQLIHMGVDSKDTQNRRKVMLDWTEFTEMERIIRGLDSV